MCIWLFYVKLVIFICIYGLIYLTDFMAEHDTYKVKAQTIY